MFNRAKIKFLKIISQVPQIVSLDVSGCQIKKIAARAFQQVVILVTLSSSSSTSSFSNMIYVKTSEYVIVVIVLVIDRNIRNTTIHHCCHQQHQSPNFNSSGFSHIIIFTLCRLMPSRSFIFITTRYQRWQNGVTNKLQSLRWWDGVTNLQKVLWCQNVWITNQPQPQRGKKIQKHNWKLVTSIGTSLLGANKKLTQLIWFPILSEFEANLKQMLEYFTRIDTSIVYLDKLGKIEKASLFLKKKKWTGVNIHFAETINLLSCLSLVRFR